MPVASFKSYTFGFIASLALTVAAYLLVMNGVLSGNALVAAILALAFVQLVVQMVFFLYVASESGTRWNLWSFLSTVLLIAIIVLASIWIMNHLNYRMMSSPELMREYIEGQQGF